MISYGAKRDIGMRAREKERGRKKDEWMYESVAEDKMSLVHIGMERNMSKERGGLLSFFTCFSHCCSSIFDCYTISEMWCIHVNS